MTAVPARRPPIMAPLQVPDFRLLLAGFVLGQAMMPLQFVTQIFWVQEHVGSEWRIVLVGLIGTMRGTGLLAFGLFGGALADRVDRRRLLVWVQVGALVVNLGIALLMLVSDGGLAGLALFFGLTFFSSAAQAIDLPTRQAMAPELLGPRFTPSGLALMMAGMQVTSPIAIFAVGPLADSIGFAATYALSGLGHLAAAVTGWRMRYRSAATGPQRSLRETVEDIRAGVRYTRNHETVLWVILILVTMMALGFPPTANLGPTWITTVVGASYSEFSFIALSWGAGALIASTTLTRFAHIERKGMLVAAAALIYAGGFVVFSIGHSWHFAVLGNLALGVGMATGQVSAAALIAHQTPNAVRGRVMSLLGLNMGIAQTLTLGVAAMGQVVSLETLFPVLAFTAVGLVGLIIVTHPHVWTTRVRDDVVPAPPAEPALAVPAEP